jgi:hypothetical protein
MSAKKTFTLLEQIGISAGFLWLLSFSILANLDDDVCRRARFL